MDFARVDRHMTEFDIYLASASPRRQALLAQIDVRFRQVGVEVDESRQGGESPADYACRLALEKARAGVAKRPAGDTRPVLGADTIVIAGDEVLGKPRDPEHGLHMLALLSGRTHAVLSAVAVVGHTEAVCCSESLVTFRELNGTERRAYWDSGEPADKAGAYAIQGLAAAFIARLEGSYSGVMGLPLFETASLLSRIGIDVVARRQPKGIERHE
jgi:septum formation protein